MKGKLCSIFPKSPHRALRISCSFAPSSQQLREVDRYLICRQPPSIAQMCSDLRTARSSGRDLCIERRPSCLGDISPLSPEQKSKTSLLWEPLILGVYIACATIHVSQCPVRTLFPKEGSKRRRQRRRFHTVR